MPVPHYQASSGAIIFTMTPEEKAIYDAEISAKKALDAAAHARDKYESLDKKYTKLLELIGSKLGISDEEIESLSHEDQE